MNDDFLNDNDMDNSFVEKKKAPILQIFGIIILILLLASGIYYYFISDKEMNNILNNILNNDAVKSILNNEEVSNYIKEKNA